MMKCNVGGIDRRLRIIAGVAIIAAGVYFQSWLGAIGLIPLLTGVIGWCPAYLSLDFSSAKKCNCGHKEDTADK